MHLDRFHTEISIPIIGLLDPDLLPEPPAFFRGALDCNDCIHTGIASRADHDDCQRADQYPWNLDLSPNSLGAFHVDWVIGCEIGFEG
jgi:hypothetical protein